jgi:hypothetical protein
MYALPEGDTKEKETRIRNYILLTSLHDMLINNAKRSKENEVPDDGVISRNMS